jgi:hypothetical protein
LYVSPESLYLRVLFAWDFLLKARDRSEMLAELFDDFQHPVAIENRRGLRQTAKGRARDAEFFSPS